MRERQTATIRTRLFVGYSHSLTLARKCHKGLRIGHLRMLMLLGQYPDGITCIDASRIEKINRASTYEKLKRVISAGVVYKENKRYYLTDSGRAAYDAICKQFDATLEEIIKELVKEAARRSGG